MTRTRSVLIEKEPFPAGRVDSRRGLGDQKGPAGSQSRVHNVGPESPATPASTTRSQGRDRYNDTATHHVGGVYLTLTRLLFICFFFLI